MSQSSCRKFVCGPLSACGALWRGIRPLSNCLSVEVSYIQTDALSASVCHLKVPLGPGGRMQPWGQQKPEKLLLQSTSGDHWKSFLKNIFIWCFLYPVRNTWSQHLIQYLEWNTTTGLPKWWFPTGVNVTRSSTGREGLRSNQSEEEVLCIEVVEDSSGPFCKPENLRDAAVKKS